MPENQSSLVPQPRSALSFASPALMERRTPGQQQLSVVDIWQMLIRRKVAILGFAVAIFCLAAAYTFLKTPVYEGIARLQIDPNRSGSLGLDDSEKDSSAVDVDGRVKTEVTIIQSDTVAMRVMESLGLYHNPHFAGKDVVNASIQNLSQLGPSQRQRLLERFNNDLVVKVMPGTQVVEIRFRSSDPVLATETANSIIDEYMQRNFHVRVDGTMQVSQWLSRQMDEVRASTTDSQAKLADFQRKNNLLGTDESDNIVTDRLKQLNVELTQAEADRIVKEGRYRLARSGNPELIASVVPSTTLQVLRTQEADLRAQYAQMSAKFGNGYPKVRELQSQLASLETAINAEGGNIETRLANEFDAAAKAEAMIRDDFEKQKGEAYKLNENVAQYAILKHEVESGQQLYDTLQLKVKEAGITSGLASSYVSVVDRAQIPDKPVEPRKTLNLALGLGGGLFGGLLLGLLLDSFDDTVRTSDELESVTALPELTSVPFVASLSRKQSKRPGLASILASEFGPMPVRDPNCPAGEAYRALSSVVLLSSLDNPPKVLVVTSAVPGEGKSTVSCNLATALAQGGRRVLLVDADLRCSSLHRHLGLTKEPGLTTMFTTQPTEYPRYQPIANLPNLHVVPAGFRPAGPAEILASGKMQELIAAWRKEYDHIIVDTPPMLPFADALVLSARADGVILVTRSGVSRGKALLRACAVLSRSGANVLGFVLNAVRRPEYYYEYPDSYKELVDNHQRTSADKN
jgi:capsular exopolysaccharide synthesis family protein